MDVPLAEVPQPFDLEPMDPEVADPVPEQESSCRIMSNMSLDEELASLLFPSPRELACRRDNSDAIKEKLDIILYCCCIFVIEAGAISSAMLHLASAEIYFHFGLKMQ